MRIRFNKKLSERIIGLNEIKREDDDDMIPEISLEIGADDEEMAIGNPDAVDLDVGDEDSQDINAADDDD